MKSILIRRDDEGVSILYCNEQVTSENAANLVSQWEKQNGFFQVKEWAIIDSKDVPEDRANRDNWKFSEGKIIVD